MSIDGKIKRLEIIKQRIIDLGDDEEEIALIVTFQLFPLLVDPLIHPEFRKRAHYFIDLTEDKDSEEWQLLIEAAHSVHTSMEVIKKAVDLNKFSFKYSEPNDFDGEVLEWNLETYLQMFEPREGFSFCRSCMSFGAEEPRKEYARYRALVDLLMPFLQEGLLVGEAKEAYHTIRRGINEIGRIIIEPIHKWYTDAFDDAWMYIYIPGTRDELAPTIEWAPILCDELIIHLSDLKGDKKKIDELTKEKKIAAPTKEFVSLDTGISFSQKEGELRYYKKKQWFTIPLSKRKCEIIQRLYARRKETGNARAISNNDIAKAMDVTPPFTHRLLTGLNTETALIGKDLVQQTSDKMWTLNQEFSCFIIN